MYVAPVFMTTPLVTVLLLFLDMFIGRDPFAVLLVGVRAKPSPFRVSTGPTRRPASASLPPSPLLYAVYTRALSPCCVGSVNSARVLGVNRYAGGAEVSRQPPMPVRIPRAPVGIDGPLQVGCPEFTNMNYDGTYGIRVFCLLFVSFIVIL